MNPVVVVLTPSMDLERNETSSTYTPGARYSGIVISLSASPDCYAGVMSKTDGGVGFPVGVDCTTSSCPNTKVIAGSCCVSDSSSDRFAGGCVRVLRRSGMAGDSACGAYAACNCIVHVGCVPGAADEPVQFLSSG